jgi:hypothetical protein
MDVGEKGCILKIKQGQTTFINFRPHAEFLFFTHSGLALLSPCNFLAFLAGVYCLSQNTYCASAGAPSSLYRRSFDLEGCSLPEVLYFFSISLYYLCSFYRATIDIELFILHARNPRSLGCIPHPGRQDVTANLTRRVLVERV